MIKVYTGVVFMILLVCASSGQIKGSRFIDNTYDFEILFPNEYELTVHGEKSVKRVHAMKWRHDMTLRRKPLFVISGIDTTAKFANVVQAQKNVHFEPEYYLSCEIENEENKIIRGRSVYLVYYKGVAVKAAAAFIDLENIVLKIEYIVDADFFDDDEFMGILENISVITN